MNQHVKLCIVSMLMAFSPAAAAEPDSPITWKKLVIDKAFRSEGSAVADVNRDGKADLLVGDLWYAAPDWKTHEIRKVGDYGDGAKGYSQAFACWADDVNRDGWPDLVVVGYPGKPCHWYENPRNQPGHWQEHLIWNHAGNETPKYVDLLGSGQGGLLISTQPEGQFAFFRPGKDPTQPWELNPISERSTKENVVPGTNPYTHGLGAGDLNGDGKLDVITTDAWWEQPAKLDGKPWKMHKANLGSRCADMYAADIDGDGKADVLSSSAHHYGIWADLQRKGEEGSPAFVRQELFPKLFSQSHALHFTDVNGDGLPDLITGKRRWAHGPLKDPDPNGACLLYWFEAKKAADGTLRFLPRQIDDDSGIGTQFSFDDVNGDKLPDVVVSNKKGVHVFLQQRR